MWSDKHYYLNIYKDKNLSSFVHTKELISFLDTIPELTRTNNFTFKNHFIDISLLFAEHSNSWSSTDVSSEKTNLLAIVCVKSNPKEFEEIKTLLIKIASFLNWQLVDEWTDDEIEDFVLWAPESNKQFTLTRMLRPRSVDKLQKENSVAHRFENINKINIRNVINFKDFKNSFENYKDKVEKIMTTDLNFLWMDDYYDGMLWGMLEYKSQYYRFEIITDYTAAIYPRVFAIIELTKEQLADELFWHDLFVKHVGNHNDFIGETLITKPQSEHHLFYDKFRNRPEVNYDFNILKGCLLSRLGIDKTCTSIGCICVSAPNN